MQKEQYGILAKDLRVKISREPAVAGKAYKIPGQIGFKNRGGTWDNYWIDIWCWPDQGERLQLAKGDVVFVTGQFKITENTYQGNTKTEYSIWADAINRQQGQGAGQDQPQPDRQPARGNQNAAPQRQHFPSEASGMDAMPGDGMSDVPF